MKRSLLILSCILISAFSIFSQKCGFYNIKELGATGVKDQYVTNIIQKAIDDCSKNGGGTVFFPAGNYLSGPIVLKSNVNLNLESGAILYTSRRMEDYPIDPNYKADAQANTVFKTTFLSAENAQNISITGLGTIDGQAEQIWSSLIEVDKFIAKETEIARQAGVPMERAYQKDPKVRLVYIMFSKNIVFKDVTIKNSPDWNLHLGRCQDVSISGVKVRSDLKTGVNSDGIDIDGCKNVEISNCNVQTGDDAICLKSTLLNDKFENCENISVSNCTLTSTSTALKIGTESHGDFKNIVFNNCVISDSNRGMSIVIRDGGNVSNVEFSNITVECNRKHFNWWGNGDPIWITLQKRNPTSRLGSIKNISFSNIKATGQGTSIIEGFQDNLNENLAFKPIENIRFKNVQLEMKAESLKDKRATSGFEARFVDSLSMENVALSWDSVQVEKKWNNAFVFNTVNQFKLEGLKGKQAQITGSAFAFDNCTDGVINNCEALKRTDYMFSFSGKSTKNIELIKNKTQNASRRIETKENVSKSEIKVPCYN